MDLETTYLWEKIAIEKINPNQINISINLFYSVNGVS